MANSTDEVAATPQVAHDPPSLPASPLPKRTKVIEPTTSSLAAAPQIEEPRTATPTPLLPTTLHHTTTTNGDAHATPSLALAAAMSSSAAAPIPIPPLQVKLRSSKARAPTRGSAFAAGYDLYSSQETVIPSRGQALVDTDISIAVPAGTYGRVAPRSGLAAKHSIDVGAGVIDADYRGPVKVILFNFGQKDFEVKEGDRIAQLIVERIYTPEVLVVEELEESVRGAGGFGSTGGFASGVMAQPATAGATGAARYA